MTERPGYRFSKGELDWVAANLDDLQDWARGRRISSWTLVGTFLTGLVVHVVGFALLNGALSVPDSLAVDLIADVLATLGIALWTSVIIVLFVETIPNWNRHRAQAWAREALAALQARGDEVSPPPDDADPADATGTISPRLEAKLDAILNRLAAIEAAASPGSGPTR